MRLIDRARQRRDEQMRSTSEQREASDRRTRGDLAAAASRILELAGEDRITASMLQPVWAEKTGHRELYQFDYEDLHFVIGEYWHGNPGDSLLLAVQVETVRGWPEWPPPHPQSVSNTRWAPGGYRPVYGLANLAAAFDGERTGSVADGGAS